MKFDNYIFDLYGTLVDIHTEDEKPEVWEKMALFYGYYNAVYRPEELQKRFMQLTAENHSQSDRHEAFPEIKIEQVFFRLFDEKKATADETLAVHAGQFFRILTTEYVRVYEGAAELLSDLKSCGKKIYLLSNAQRIFTEYEMHLLKLTDYFDDIFISSECGVKKPDKLFFRLLMDKHRLDAGKSIMIGNDMDSDIKGAGQMGLSTFYIHSNISPELKEAPCADYVLMEMDMQKVRKILL